MNRLMLLLLLGASVCHAEIPQMVSEYSPLDKCKMITQREYANEPPDAYEARCPAHDGYSVTILGGDDRTWIVLQKGKNKVNLQGIGEGDVQFPIIAGTKLEWRYQVTGAEKKLVALIFRVKGQDAEATSEKEKSFLYVVRPMMNGFCLLGKTQSNDSAHHIADTVKQCN